MFKSIRKHLLLDEPLDKTMKSHEVERKIHQNIKSGRNFISNYRRGDAHGFRFWAEAEQKQYNMGESFIADRAKLFAQLPQKAQIKLIRNGQIYKNIRTSELELEVPQGNYRLEAEVKKRGWIYTNHIKIRGKTD